MEALLHLAGLLATAGISLGLAWWIRGQTQDHAGTVMILLLCSHAGMAVLAGAHILADGTTAQIAFFQLRYLLGLLTFPLWLLLAIYYTGRTHWLTRPVWAALLGPAVAIGVLWLTDPLHGLMVVEYQQATVPFTYVRPTYTGFSLASASILMFFPVFAFGLFLRMFLFSKRNYRWQTAAVLTGMLSVFVTAGISESSGVPAPGFAYAIFGSGIFGILVAVALFRTKLFAVLPMASDVVFESIDDAIVILDGEHRIVDFNGTARDLFPDLDDAVDVPLSDTYPGLVAADDAALNDGGGAEAIVDRIDGAVDSPFSGTVEVTSGGETSRLRVSVSEITNGGEPRGYVLILRDVTSLEEYATALERKTTELEAKTQKLEQFASVLSHDLRNPIAVATGYVEHALDTGEVEHAEKSLGALERMDATIENLLALARQGETIDDPAVVSLAAVVDEAWETSDTGTAALANEVPPEYRCRADPERLQTLLENLFRNAVEHSSASPASQARQDAVDHGGDAVRAGLLDGGFFVADDGPGVPEDERERVFEYGYTTSADGTGLGLAIVKGIADAHEWEIRMGESEDGGARVEVRSVEVVRSVAEQSAT